MDLFLLYIPNPTRVLRTKFSNWDVLNLIRKIIFLALRPLPEVSTILQRPRKKFKCRAEHYLTVEDKRQIYIKGLPRSISSRALLNVPFDENPIVLFFVAIHCLIMPSFLWINIFLIMFYSYAMIKGKF